MDEVAIYGKTLTAENVAAHFNAGTPDAYSASVIGDEPLVYWRFEENFLDEMDHYDLIPSGVNFVQGPQASSNKALFGRVTSDTAESLYDVTDYTYELWFNPINESSSSYILFRRPAGSQHAVIFAYKPNALEFYFTKDAAGSDVRPLVEIPNQTDRWYYCVVVNDTAANQMRIYIDGELAVSIDASAVPGSGNEVVVGGSDKGDNFNGYIDEVAMYDFLLTEDRIQAHFNAQFGTTRVESWPLY